MLKQINVGVQTLNWLNPAIHATHAMVAENCASSLRSVDFGVSAIVANDRGSTKTKLVGDSFEWSSPS